jgi:isoquinoline 1-oxidoreductase/isoquinoline 1-oxidoreductase beta subunit
MGLGRRRFILGTLALAGGGLGVAVWSGSVARRRRLAPDATTLEPSAWLQVDTTGGITLQVDRVEMGQGVITGFVTLVAEELDVPPDRIRPVLAPVHPRFQDPAQLTGESTSMRKRFEPLRQTGAAARALLLQAAAAEWGVAVATLDTDGTGHVVDAAGGRRLPYAALAAAAAQLPVPADVALRDPARFRYIGGRVARPDLPDKVRGAARFGIDTQLPGLLTAVIARSPELRGGLRGFDAARARAVPGVVDAFAVPAGVAVVAEGFWAARQGARALAVDWAPGPLAAFSTATMAADQARALASGTAHVARDDGDPAAVLAATTAAGGPVLAADYALPYLAHATLEPMNATLWFRGDACEAWIPSQAPDLARQVICDLAGLAREAVTVHTTLSGGGFGRRATVDYVAEAAAIARRFDRPVKLVWTREDDLGHGPFREASRHALRASLGTDGRIAAWEHRLTGVGLNHLLMPATLPLLAPDWLPTARLARAGAWLGPKLDDWFGSFTARQGSTDHPYAVPATRVEVVNWQPGVPVTIWRSVGHSYNGFVVEAFIDELSALAGADPLAFRRQHLAGEPRVLAVLDLLADRSGWGRPPPGRAQGLALQVAFGSVVAQVAEVSCAGGQIRVHRVTCAADCGTAVNPDVVRQQLEGGIVFGLGAALHGEVRIDAGQVRDRNFDGYRQLTLADSPVIDVHLVPSTAPPGGIGEAGVPPIAPAVANAVFAATGRRLRQLPLRLAPPQRDAQRQA